MPHIIRTQPMSKEEVNPNFSMAKSGFRKDASGAIRKISYAKLDENQLREQENDEIGMALIKQAERGEFNVAQFKNRKGEILPNRATGFARHVKEQQAGKITASVNQNELSEDAIALRAELKRNERLASGKTGFADFLVEADTEPEFGSEYHDDDRQDFEHDRNDSSGTGPVGFSDTFHGTPEDDFPEDRDKAEPYGGNAIGGSVGKKSRFTRPDGKKKLKPIESDEYDVENDMVQHKSSFKGNDGDNDDLFESEPRDVPHASHQREGRNKTQRRQAGSGTTQEEGDSIETVTPLTHENPRTETLQDQNRYNLLPQEPGRIDVPGNSGGGRDMQDPFGDEEENFEFNREGDPSLPGKSQDYPDKKVRVTEIGASKRIVSSSGKTYIGRIVAENKVEYIVDGIRTGDITRKQYRVAKKNIVSFKDYSIMPKQKQMQTSLEAAYEKVESGKEKIMEIKMASDINKKYFGLTGKAPKLNKEEALAHTDKNEIGDGELYGDDAALKDQLDFHESKVAKLKRKIASLLEASEMFDEDGKEKEAEECIAKAETIQAEIKNSDIRVAQLKREASGKIASKKMFFDNSNEDGNEKMFD